MSLRTRLERLVRQQEANRPPCDCWERYAYGLPIFEVQPGEPDPDPALGLDRCPKCGWMPPVSMMIVHLPEEVSA